MLKYSYSYTGEDVEVKACPFCGKTDELYVTMPRSYYDNLEETGRACIAITCKRCNLDLYEHTDKIRLYGDKVRALVGKWDERPALEAKNEVE